MSQDWITVFTGPIGEAVAVRAKLEARGIPVFTPGETMRQMGMLGDFGVDLSLDPSIQVPPSAVEAARACIEGRDEEPLAQVGEQELPPDFFAAEPEANPDLMARARMFSRCILWGAIFPFGAPFALGNLGPYLSVVKQLDREPPNHRLTIAAACLSPLNCLPLLMLL